MSVLITAAVQRLVKLLASAVGASSIGWIQLGTGAVLRWVLDKLHESVSTKDFGAKCDGIADDTAKVLLAQTAVGPGGLLVFRGIHNIVGDIDITCRISAGLDQIFTPTSNVNITNNDVFPEWFGATMAAADCAPGINKAYVAAKKFRAWVIYQARSYPIASGISLNYVPNTEGVPGAVRFGGRPRIGTAIEPGVFAGYAFSVDGTTETGEFSTGGTIKGITLNGSKTANDGWYLHNVGYNANIENLIAEDFQGALLHTGYLQDANLTNVTLHRGGFNGTPALKLGASSNYVKFFNLNIAGTPLMMVADSVSNIDFYGAHLEIGDYGIGHPLSVYYNSPPIAISNSTEVKFHGGSLVPATLENLMSQFGVTADAASYFIDYNNCINYEFNGTTFTSPGMGIKPFNQAASGFKEGGILDGCTFNGLTMKTYGVNLNYSTLRDAKIHFYDDLESTVSKGVQVSYCRTSDVLMHSDAPTAKTKTAGALLNGLSPIGTNTMDDVSFEFTVPPYVRATGTMTLLSPGNAGENFSVPAGVITNLDMQRIPDGATIVTGAASPISALTNMKLYQMATLVGAGGAGAVVRNVAGVQYLKGGVDALIPPNATMTLKHTEPGIVREIARSF